MRNNPTKHTLEFGRQPYNYLLFDSVSDFNHFTDSQNLLLSPANRKVWEHIQRNTRLSVQRGSTWYGTPAPSSMEELEGHKIFQKMELLAELQPRIREHLQKYIAHLQTEVLPKPKVDYNDRGLGMFSFERAAMGLFRHSQLNVSSPIERTSTQLNIELGRFDIATRVKSVYAYFQHKDSSCPSIRLYLLCGANAYVEGNAIYYVGLACAELVAFMEERGVSVEVNALLGSQSGAVNLAVIRVKRFQDALDKNQLLLISSDPRYFRFRGFKAIISLYDYFGRTVPPGLGQITDTMAKDFVPALKNEGFVFEQSYSLEAAAREVKRIIETYHHARNNAKAA